MTTQEFFSSKIFQRILWGILAFVVAFVIFELGEFVGFTKASFSYQAGDNYYRTFGSGHEGAGSMFPPDDLPLSHGISGKIIKVALPDVFIAGDDGVEKEIVTDSDTLVRYLRDSDGPQDLKVDDVVIVIGSPNSAGQIEAKLVRIVGMATTTAQ